MSQRGWNTKGMTEVTNGLLLFLIGLGSRFSEPITKRHFVGIVFLKRDDQFTLL